MKRTAKMLGMLLVLVFITLTAGCATYPAKGKMPNFNDPSSLNADTKVPTRMGEGIIASAYPLTTKEENEKYFDEDLIESGIFAIFLEIQNENNEGVKLTATNLNFDGGQSSAPMAMEDLYKIMKKDPYGRATFWYFFGLYVGAPISAYATYKTNEKIEEDLKSSKLLSLGNIPKGIARGFMCFRIPENTNKDTPLPPKGNLELIFNKEGRLINFNLPI